ncbi:MAG TPA: hypothetical protein P5114_11560 [Hyphomicrobiaceae bacterium]|nr:hypothetical protein [Hyphomicrobiaceae bacterium]
MTTIYAAAAARRYFKSFAFAGMITILGLGLSGCETGTSIFGSSDLSSPSTELAAPTTPATAAKLAVAPIIGAPETVAKQVQSSVSSALTKQNITVAKDATDKSDYTLRGYVVSAREKSGVKVSYIWDVTDQAGQRLKRITGEEMVTAGADRDPWASVSSQVIDTITGKAASQIATWLPSQRAPTAASATPIANASSAHPQARTVAAAPMKTPGPTTGSIGSGPTNALVPNVTGAPGDGRISLTSALQRELSKNGISLTTTASANTYRVEGVVDVGQAKDGKQPIKIDWHVKDPTGKSVGTVSQKNEIAAGALDGAWGATADAAAAAAAQGIMKLIPKTN